MDDLGSLDGLLQQIADPAEFSFYGLKKKQEHLDQFFVKANDALLMKAPPTEMQELGERKDEIVKAQTSLKQVMVHRLEKPELMKREQPLAEAFIEQLMTEQRRKKNQDSDKLEKVLTRLKEIQSLVRSAKSVPDSRPLKEVEASIKTLEAEWKEVAPIQEKWEAGRHSFKSNTDLQAHKRRYEACRKGREEADSRLEAALCRAVDVREAEAVARAEAKAEQLRREGWAGVAKKATGPNAATGNKSGSMAKRPQPPRRPAAPAAWDTAEVTLAQRIRAEAAAQVREGLAGAQEDAGEDLEEDDDDEEDEEEEQAPPPPPKAPSAVVPKPPPPIVPKPPPPAVPKQASSSTAPPVADASGGEQGGSSLVTSGGGSSVSAKRKGKSAKRRAETEKDAPDAPAVQDAGGSSTLPEAWKACTVFFDGSVLASIATPAAWKPLPGDADAEPRLTELVGKLPWANPLGLALPFSWQEFLVLEVDFGPATSSKRGESPGLDRLRTNISMMIAMYLTITFFFLFLNALSHFGSLLWAVVLQSALIIVPPETVPQVTRSARVLYLQAAHLVLWLLFMRSLWVMNFWLKLLSIIAACAHAYVIVPPKAACS